jgi:hypothetical protein
MSKKYFKNIILCKSILLILIIIWGGTVQISNAENIGRNSLTDLGGVLFSVFSVLYLMTCYQLYNFKVVSKKVFLPLVALFVVLGFVTEVVNPMQIDKNLFYLVIFYIVSPIFFIAQGLVIGMVYFSSISQQFAVD